MLIGPNGSGKSNFLEVFALLKAAPRDISEHLVRMGGSTKLLWKGSKSSPCSSVTATVDYPECGLLQHSMKLADERGRLVVTGEKIDPPDGDENEPSYVRAIETNSRDLFLEFTDDFRPGESLLSFTATPEYKTPRYLNEQYGKIRIFRNWSLGPAARSRYPCDTHGRSEFLNDGPQGPENLALVLSNIRGEERRRFVTALQGLFDGIVDVSCPVTGGTVSLFLEEREGGQIPASRLSDGTLQYLCLLSVLTHPKPPPFIAIEEPELGLHPDAVAQVAELLVDAARRTQLVVTTHSRMLIDALSDYPSSVVVCEKHNGESRFERLDGKRLQSWLHKFSLGDLWGSGELGGNRW